MAGPFGIVVYPESVEEVDGLISLAGKRHESVSQCTLFYVRFLFQEINFKELNIIHIENVDRVNYEYN